MNGFEVIFTYVVPAFCGLIAGVVGSLVAPWVQWGIEKQREKLNYRRKLIEKWRNAIEQDFEQLEFSNTVLYSELRPHLSKETKDSIERNHLTIRLGRGGNVIKSLVLDDIAELEKDWDLI